MKQVIYISPVPLNSPSQRPHHLVQWLHERFNANIIWVDPYPSRLPKLQDLNRLRRTHHVNLRNLGPSWSEAPWLKIIKPHALPIEPLPGGTGVIALMQKKLRNILKNLLKDKGTWLIIGKPCGMAVELSQAQYGMRVLYDVMDDVPEFLQGLSRKSAIKNHQYIVESSSYIWGSSTKIVFDIENKFNKKASLVRNGTNIKRLINNKDNLKINGIIKLGYIGSIASWFDWNSVIKLADSSKKIIIDIYGPKDINLPKALPENIKIFDPIPHSEVFSKMCQWDVGLIPFHKNPLTDSVDPVKYYEYKACGLLILSTMFGEMQEHIKNDHSLWAIENLDFSSLETKIENWLISNSKKSKDSDIILNTWDYRFEKGAKFCHWL